MNTARRLRFLFVLLLAALLAACAGIQPRQDRPRLLVVLVVDGLPQRQVLGLRDQLAPDGFARFLDRGAWFSQARYGHAHTVTAAGHAALLTGAYPHRTGIIGNDWRDPSTAAVVYNTADPQASYIGNPTDPRRDGTSPKNLKVETLGDVLRRADAGSRVVAVSGKDRGAILLAGKSGTAYMYMEDTGRFVSSSYYMARHPAWVDAFNAARPADRYFRTQWRPLLPDAAYERSLPDGQPWFGRPGSALPLLLGDGLSTPAPAYYLALLASPFVDELTFEFARGAIAAEQLGQRAATDILALSLSGHDYVNHTWSAESRFSQDHLLRLDRMLQDFLWHLDATVGKDNYIAVLTADHGFMPAPEVSRAQGRDAGRIFFAQSLARMNASLAARFGEGRWVLGNSASSLFLNKRLMEEKGVESEAIAQEARRLLLEEPGIEAAYTRGELLSGSRAGAPFFAQMRRAWHPDVSGEVQYAPRPNWMFGNAAATHGSPHPYDTHVPILLWGPRWVKPGRVNTPVEPVDIVPTLAKILHVPAPAASEGKMLPLP